MNGSLLLYALDFPPTTGGIQTLTHEVYSRLPHLLGAIIAPAAPGDAPRRLGGVEVERSRYPSARGWRTLLYLRDANRLLTAHRGARRLVHCNHVFAAAAAWRLRARTGMDYVVWVHGEELTKTRHPWAVRQGLRHASGIFVDSDFTTARVCDLLEGAPPPPIHRLPLGAPPRWLDAAPAPVRSFLPHSTEPFRLLTVARLSSRDRYKGIDTVIAAVGILRRQGRDVLYEVAGAGDDLDYLQRLAREHGVEAHVHFLGRVPDAELMSVYDRADLFLLCSREQPTPRGLGFEGFGIVLLEAGARAKAVIGGNSGGIPNAVVEGVTGLLADPRSPAAVATAVEQLLANPEARARMGAAGRQRVRTEFNWDRTATLVAAIHEHLLPAAAPA